MRKPSRRALRADAIARHRLDQQCLTRPLAGTAAELVAWMGAVQAQEYHYARWGLGLRLAGEPTAAAIECEIAAGAILRTRRRLAAPGFFDV